MTTVAAFLHFAARVLIAVSEELLRAAWSHDTTVPDYVPDWCDDGSAL